MASVLGKLKFNDVFFVQPPLPADEGKRSYEKDFSADGIHLDSVAEGLHSIEVSFRNSRKRGRSLTVSLYDDNFNLVHRVEYNLREMVNHFRENPFALSWQVVPDVSKWLKEESISFGEALSAGLHNAFEDLDNLSKGSAAHDVPASDKDK